MKNKLYNLVNAMAPNEKGYFVKQFADQDALYCRMFQILSKQRVYSEEKIKKEMAGTYIANNFSFAKNYLYKSIVKSLINYGSSPDLSFYYISSINVLYEKGLYRDCVSLMKKAVKEATRKNDYLTLLQMIQQTKLLLHSNIIKDKVLNDLLKMEPEVLKKQQILSTYQSILAEIKMVRVKKGSLYDSESYEEINKIKNHPFLKNLNNVIDLSCELLYHQSLFLCGHLLENEGLANRHIKLLEQLVSDTNEHKSLSEYRKIEILIQLSRHHTASQNESGNQNTLFNLKKVLDDSSGVNHQVWVEAYAYLYSYQTNILLKKKEIHRTETLFKEINRFLKKYDENISQERQMTIVGNMLILDFMNDNFRNVLQLVNNFMALFRDAVRKDVVTGVMLVELVVCYELDKIDLMESRLMAFERFLKTNNMKATLWTLYIHFIRGLIKGEKLKPLAKELELNLTKMKRTPLTNEYHFLEDWVNKKSQ